MDSKWDRSRSERLDSIVEFSFRFSMHRKFDHRFWMIYIELKAISMNNFQYLKTISNQDNRKQRMNQQHSSNSNDSFEIFSWIFVTLSRSKERQINEARAFIPRNSILTDLFEISHIRSIRNVFVAVLLIFVIQVMINDIIEYGRINLNFELIFQCFGNIHMVLFIWVLMYLATSIVAFMGFHQWSKNRVFYLKYKRNLSKNHLSNNPIWKSIGYFSVLETYDLIWLMIYIAYIVLFLVFPCREIVKHQLPVASSLIILLEQVRMNERIQINHFCSVSVETINENLFIHSWECRKSSRTKSTNRRIGFEWAYNLPGLFEISVFSLRTDITLPRWLSSKCGY